ncbi:MAG: phosphoenolpyruvate carboxykinase (ATP) [Chloroflexi bacterium]|nr:MAG: phosphoenolpyruvate carboxykinase (ATP) [Chloroflexota bacterium]
MVETTERTVSRHSLEHHGLRIASGTTVHWNLAPALLYEHALLRREGELASHGPLSVVTGEYTGRSPKDKFFVRQQPSEQYIDWGPVNQPFDPQAFAALHARVAEYLSSRDELFVQDLYVGADPNYRMPVRVVTEAAWHSLFSRIMFIRPPRAELGDIVPRFTVLQAPGFLADPARDGTRTKTFIIANLEEGLILVGGTEYAGEIKKSIFSIMNYLLPLESVMPMHCSANVGAKGDVALFFGLSGTGKTTLSSDPTRTLIGDDEHGWSDAGIFNFEGGCYAKVINLSASAEPEIYAATRTFGTVLENCVLDPITHEIDYDDDTLTENTRAAYPIDMISNASTTGVAGHPDNILFLTADAFGVLPPIAKLTPEQASYYFLLGYTAKVAGTERGLSGAEATFSSCFGSPFMTLSPNTYGRLLAEKIRRHAPDVWLVNTGWTGGPYGVGERISIAHTRAIVRAALDGDLHDVPLLEDPIFGIAVPRSVPGVPDDVLVPSNTWADKAEYERVARELAASFNANFATFADQVDEAIRNAGPRTT